MGPATTCYYVYYPYGCGAGFTTEPGYYYPDANGYPHYICCQ